MSTYRAKTASRDAVIVTDRSLEDIRKLMPGYDWREPTRWEAVRHALTRSRFSWLDLVAILIIGAFIRGLL